MKVVSKYIEVVDGDKRVRMPQVAVDLDIAEWTSEEYEWQGEVEYRVITMDDEFLLQAQSLGYEVL